ncbi:S8 family peptidase [Stenotrophomonas indicatrix]|jgi:serine protease|uniref:Serine protease n=1 Tax=Stenotrophomonas indicatrix TaxID=2045451 RepID=A0A1W1H1L7_9GAMM|nr:MULTISPECIES: S8 family peptidase [Stenotrophomonas]OJH78109.1 MAG: protease [Stenotrophomonas maltophilia]EZP44048.1 Protease [Stenotrophomonas sp. RIT309]MBA0100150.1 S8 family serine peptidase [Stenotrophomonas indicatrix]MCK6232409.1 S8 family serine peptidase [Stenotrophomonas indicatrix]MDF2481199.1 protease [Stenotrophomonas indicatrix]
MTLKRISNVTKKQTLRINVLAAAVLSLTVGVGAAHAAKPGVAKEPARVASTAQQSVDGIIVKYRNGTAAASDRSTKLSVVQSALSRAIVSSGTTSRAAALSPLVERKLGTGGDLIRLKSRLGSADMQKVLAELNADPSVQYAVANVRLQRSDLRATNAQPALVPNDPNYAQYQWNFFNATGGVNAPAAWDLSQGEGIVVAVLDTGILPGVPDFGSNLLEGYDFISDKESSRRPNDGRAPGATDYGDWVETANECYTGSEPEGSSWHGTHVAGTIAEVTNNGSALAGLAYKAKVLPVRVLGKCGGTLADISDAITWASGGTVPGIPANTNPAEIINMSLGGGGACDAAYQDAINGAVSRGTLVVVAAGNETDNASKYRPASCNNVVAVGATRVTGGITYYSNYGTAVDLSAPGGGGSVDGNPNGYIWQVGSSSETTPDAGEWVLMGKGGTSMSSPHVAAVAAMVQSALIAKGKEPLAPAALETLLKQSARKFPVTIPAATPIGTGILDAKAALDAALKEPCTENCEPEGIPLTNKVTVGGLAGAAASETVYTFEAAAGKTLSVLTYGGSGNVSVYLAQGRVPTATDNDAKSTRPGNTETVRVAKPVAGTYYIKVVGEAAYSGVSILATQ